MIKKTLKRNIGLAVLSVVLSVCGVRKADAFTDNPFFRYFLKSKPIADVWDAGADKESFKREYLKRKTPPSEYERALQTYIVQDDTQDEMNQWQQTERYDVYENFNEMTGVFNEILPITNMSVDNIEQDIGSFEDRWFDSETVSPRLLADLKEKLDAETYYVQTLEPISELKLELENVDNFSAKREKRTERMLIDETTGYDYGLFLGRSKDLNDIETYVVQSLKSIDDALESLSVNDVADIGALVENDVTDDVDFMDLLEKQKRFRYILDSSLKKKQSRKKVLSYDRNRIFELLKRLKPNKDLSKKQADTKR